MSSKISVILPAKNEAKSLEILIPKLIELNQCDEVIIVNDGSSDNTKEICQKFPVRIVNHPYSMGNGAAIKTGARHARGDIFVFMDADGQHQPHEIQQLLERLNEGFDMAVGARSKSSQASKWRLLANGFYNRLSSNMVNQKVLDLTSGFRAVRSDKFREFIHLLPNGFSYPTTITMAFFRAGYSVSYVPIMAKQRIGNSHIKPFQDGVRFLLIIFKIGTLYSPLKIFLPISLVFFSIATFYSAHTLLQGRFTNMSALLFSMSILIFLIGLISEQITSLMYSAQKK